MKEIPLNEIDTKFEDIIKILANKDKPDKIKFDVYNSLPISSNSMDYGYIRHNNGIANKMFIAASYPDEYRRVELYFSIDGITWFDIASPDMDVIYSDSKLVIYRGNVYLLIDDTVKMYYNFDLAEGSMDSQFIMDDILDITVVNNTLYLLSDLGVYAITDGEPELINIASDFPFEKFVKSVNNELVIIGHADSYPIFVVYDGTPHVVYCVTPCNPKTIIAYNDYIYCYTIDGRIVIISKTYNPLESKYEIHPGLQWSGEVSYHMSHFWIAYTDYIDSKAYTLIAKSSNGIDFTPDTILPRFNENDGIFTWGNDYTMCVCAGETYTLLSSVNYYNYGENIALTFDNVEIPVDRTISIETSEDIDINDYTIRLYLCDNENKVVTRSVSLDVAPYMEDGNIKFVLEEAEYDGKHLHVVLYGTKPIC